MVLALPGPAGGSLGEQVLHTREGERLGQRLVSAGDHRPVPVHQPDIGLVGQQFGHPAVADRSGWVVGPAAVAQAPRLQFGGDLLDGVGAAGIQLERGGDVGGAFGVGFDVGDLPAADGDPDVAVPEGGAGGPSALFGFLSHAVADVGREVVGVELGQQRVQPFGELAFRGGFEPFHDAFQLDAEAAELGADGDVVVEVSGEPVELVDHDHVGVALLADALEHGLELGPVVGAGAFALFDVPVDDEDVVGVGVGEDAFFLVGQRQAVLGEALAGLPFGRHSQMGAAPSKESAGLATWRSGGIGGDPPGGCRLTGNSALGAGRWRQRPRPPHGRAERPRANRSCRQRSGCQLASPPVGRAAGPRAC